MTSHLSAPEFQASQWFNTKSPPSVASSRGKVMFITAFQMLCPGCVAHGLPQAQRVRATFRESDVAVIGLHTVFEHHDAMTPVSLAAFLHEYGIGFPVAVDQHDAVGVPLTMRAYAMRGTPTSILVDRLGRIRRHKFGHDGDMELGAAIMSLVDDVNGDVSASEETESAHRCTPSGCEIS